MASDAKKPRRSVEPGQANVFADEMLLLERMRTRAGQPDASPEETKGMLLELIGDYEKLLKTSMKLARISDIQGGMLKAREQEIQIASEQLREAEQQRRELISEISHELGTPLMAIQSYLRAVLDGLLDFDARYAGMMYEKLLTMNRLIEDLFQLSTLRASQPTFDWEEVEVERLFKGLADVYGVEVAKKQIRLQVTELPAGVVEARRRVKVDVMRVKQLLGNLVDNAIKYTPEKGEITIGFAAERHDGADTLAVFVKDNGVGIPEAEQALIFHRQYRTESAKQTETGKGLGLAISSEIIAKHGGTIQVNSELGQGSVFTFRLPLL